MCFRLFGSWACTSDIFKIISLCVELLLIFDGVGIGRGLSWLNWSQCILAFASYVPSRVAWWFALIGMAQRSAPTRNGVRLLLIVLVRVYEY